MKKTDLEKLSHAMKKGIGKHGPEILLGLGITGMLTAGVLAVTSTPKALRLMEEEIQSQNYVLSEEASTNGFKDCCQISKLQPVEIVQTCWKCYAPAVLLAVLSATCLISSSRASTRRTAAIATAYKISETALSEYREKVVETIGEKKERVVRDKVAEQQIKKNPLKAETVIITEKGNTLCYDTLSGRYFRSDIEIINKVINILNREMGQDLYISLNDFYVELGLESTKLGNLLGWCSDDGLLEVDFSAQLANDGTPCLVVDFNIAPKYDYSKIF